MKIDFSKRLPLLKRYPAITRGSKIYIFLIAVLFTDITLGSGDHGHHGIQNNTQIDPVIALEAGIKTAIASSGEINRTLTVYGKTVVDPNKISHIRARFPGTITRANANVGDFVKKGDTLAQVESSESLKRYLIKAPFAGVITSRHATLGELTDEQALFTVTNFEQVWAEFQIFPTQVSTVNVGQTVTISINSSQTTTNIKHLIPSDNGKPFILARTPINNKGGQWVPGLLLEGKIVINTVKANLIIDNRALQSFQNKDVVFIKTGNNYTAHSVKLGLSDTRFTEIQAGLKPGDEYVVNNSYLIKADLEKSGASHQH